MSSAARLQSNADLLLALAAVPPSQTGGVIDGAMYVSGRVAGPESSPR